MSGAAMVEASLVRRTRAELGCSITIVYGQTETHAVVTSTHMEDSETDQSETVGQPIEQCEVKIADSATGQVLPLGVDGEICMRGHKAMLGYFRMEETTRETVKADGWLHTGDMGSMDERGFVKITGRLKDMIIRGGENIYPREIENLLHEHPKIGRAAVVGVPDSYWGEQVAAVIQLRSAGDLPTAAELHDYCRANLTHFKTPKFWYVATELPWTQTGKLQKFKLREWIAQGAIRALATD
jgi:fatty-acyl-CoA synthase